ncbi:hypothetical protein D3C78_1916500 [compost metagenome]
MPKLSEASELIRYTAPTMILAGSRDVFFPASKVMERARAIIPNVTDATALEMGHFPPEDLLGAINKDIKHFLAMNY